MCLLLLSRMSLRLPDQALLVKLFGQNGSPTVIALKKFRYLKGLQKGLLTSKFFRLKLSKF